jgi:tetratricopeptide (TPR) repeat protein
MSFMDANLFPAPCKLLSHLAALTLCALAMIYPTVALAQDTPEYQAARQRALQTYDENKFTEAVPLLEKVYAANASDVVVLSRLGFALYASTAAITDRETRRQTRARARTLLQRARELGDNSVLTQVTLDALEANEEGNVTYSDLQGADKAMREGEAAFAQGDFKKALDAYDRALATDPHLYEAALFKGDVYYKSDQQEKAGEWFARAIAIDPDRETAYRYWGDSLMKQGKMSDARDKFIEAFIAEPYTRLARAGLTQWGQRNNVTLAHPKIEIPASVTPLENGKMTINLDPGMVKDNNDDGSSAWMVYGIVRAAWATSDFAKQYPNEKVYRHSLKEEAAALRGVVEALSKQEKEKKIKKLTPSLENLVKLNRDGVLEAYILFARPDKGIAQDYPDYRRNNRDKLRRYVVEYVVNGGEKSTGA